MTVVDLRSDTVTRPTPAMREAMARAEVGDDVYGEDPTVNRLEERVAALLGKEAAVFVSSGTMANQIGLSLLAEPGTEVIVEEGAHVLNYEAGAASTFWGITLRSLPGYLGRITPEQVQPYIHSLHFPDEHVPPLRAISIENTHNRAGGAVWPLDELDAMYEVARTTDIAENDSEAGPARPASLPRGHSMPWTITSTG
jgi:threonine aldolase